MSRLIMRGVLGSVGKPHMVFGSYGSVTRFDGENWSVHAEFPSKNVQALDVHKEKILAAGQNGRVKLFDGTSWIEQQPAGNADKNWILAVLGSTHMIVGAYNGRLYLHDGTSWSEQQLAGNVDKPWFCGAHYKGKFVVSTYPGRLYYFDGSSWSEIVPYGGTDRSIRAVAINEYGILYSIYTDFVYWYDFATQTHTQHKPKLSTANYAAVGINGNRFYAGEMSSGKVYEYDGSSWSDMGLYGGANTAYRNSIDFQNNRGLITRTDVGSTFFYYWNGSSFEQFPYDQNRYSVCAAIHY